MVAAKHLGGRRVLGVVVGPEEAAPAGLHAVQRSGGHTFGHQAVLHLQPDVLRRGLHLDPRRLQRAEHGAENRAVQQHTCDIFRRLLIRSRA